MSGAIEKIFVNEITEGQEVESAFLLDDLRLGQTRSGKPFVGLKLKDRTGQIEARVWDRAEEFHRAVRKGQVAVVRGVAESFQGQVQLKITSCQPLDNDRIDPTHFRPAAARDIEEMFDELSALVQGISNPHLRGLLEDILFDPDLARSLKKAPAAKRFHHAYVGGLLEHTLSLTNAALALTELYPDLNRDLLLAGAVVHDLGKIMEFDLGISGDYTDQGRLLGHIVLGLEILEKKLAARPDFPPELALLLKHFIVSHHGEYEMGSPRKPKTLEALALHYLDDLDAKLSGIKGFIDRHVDDDTGWTDFNRLMDRFFFRPDLAEVQTEDEPERPKKRTRKPNIEEETGRSAGRPDPDQLSFLED